MSATNVRPPYGTSDTLNTFEVRKFTGGASADNQNHRTDPLPDAHWSGKYVAMLATGGNCHFAFTRKSDAEVSRSIAATEAGATTNVGGVLVEGNVMHVRLPYWAPGSNLYFARESDAAAVVVYMWLSDEPAGKLA